MTTTLERIEAPQQRPRLDAATLPPASPSPRASVDVKVRYFVDRQTGLWGYSIESPAVLGGGCATRAEAEHSAVEALARALGRGTDTPAPGEDCEFLHVDIRAVPCR